MRRVGLWLFAVLLGQATGAGIMSAAPEHGHVILLFIVTGTLAVPFVAVSVVTAMEVLFPWLRSREHRRLSNSSAQ